MSGDDQNDALKHFQDRESAIAAFDALWQSDHAWLLTFDGFSGLGKSTLINWLVVNRCQRDSIPYSLLSFEFELDYKALLDGMLSGFQRHVGPQNYQKWRDKREEILTDRDRKVQSVVINQTQVGGSENEQGVDLALAEREREVDRQTRERLADAWLDCLIGLTGPRQVIFLDTFERYQDTAGERDLGWLWTTLHRACQALPGLRVVVGSREPVRKPERAGPGVPLEPFSPGDSDSLLISLGVTDPEFRKAVYDRLAQGHPLVTRYTAEAWREAQTSRKPLAAAQVPDVADLESAVEWIQERIIDRFADGDPLKEAVRWAPLLRSFNLDSLNAILERKLDENQFDRLTRYSFVEQAGGQRRCHDLMRRIQLCSLHEKFPDAFLACHRAAESHLRQRDPLGSLYHRFLADPDAAFQDWQDDHLEARRNYNYARLNEMFAIVESAEIALPTASRAYVLYRRGEQYYMQGEMDRARACYAEVLPLYRATQDRLGQANTLQRMGDLELLLGNHDAARRAYSDALLLYGAVQNPLGKANTLVSLGDLEQLLGNHDAARHAYAGALPLYEALQDWRGKAHILYGLGDLEGLLGNYDAARHAYDEALPLFEATKHLLGKAHSLRGLGDVERLLGNYDVARRAYSEALALYKAIQSRRGQANTLLCLGNLERLLGNHDAARRAYDAALALYRAVQSRLGQANTLQSLGDLELSLGNYETARHAYADALVLFEAIQNQLGQAHSLRGLGDLEMHLGNHAAARRSYDDALKLYETVQNRRGKAHTLISVGDLEMHLGDHAAARRSYDEALALCEADKDQHSQGDTLLRLGVLELILGNHGAARRAQAGALLLFEAVQDPIRQMNTYVFQARLECMLRNLVAAEANHLKALALAERSGLVDHPVTQNVRREYQRMKETGECLP